MPKSKPYDWTQFTLRIVINASPDKIFKAWTDEKIITKWFPIKAVIEPKKNGRIYFEWIGDVKHDAKVREVVKNKKFVFDFGNHGELVAVKIKKSGSAAILELRQYNMRTTPKSKVNMHMGCKQGWTFFMANLKAYLEHGIDLRSFDPKRCYKQDYINS